MFMIRRDHYDVLLQSDPVRFIGSILDHIADEMPDEIRGIPLPILWIMIEVAIERAKSHGLTTDGQIIGFVSVMFEIAPNFDEEPTLKAILSNTRGTPGERWDALFAYTPVVNAAWQRASAPSFYDESAWSAPPNTENRGTGEWDNT